MLRSLWIVCTALATLMPAASAAVVSGSAGPRGPRPNVLIVLTDDQRAEGTLGVMPAVRRVFGRHGTRFTNAFATTPLCCPSRASIMTGQYVHNHGLQQTYSTDEFLALHDRFQDTVVQRYLDQAGYRTALFGNYLAGWDMDRDPPHFDRWAISPGDRYRGDQWNVQGVLRKIDTYSTTFLRRKAVGFLRDSERRDRRPWFLLVAPNAPHKPFTPAARYQDAGVPPFRENASSFEEDRSDKPPYVTENETPRGTVIRERRAQLRTLMSVDDLVARVDRVLARTGESRRTLAFFASDNGYLWGEHHLSRKFVPYTYSVKIPLFVRWPGKVPQRRSTQRFAANIDLVPTILDAAGIRARHVLDGRSLLVSNDRDRILIEYFKEFPGPWAGLRTRSTQYVEYYDEQGEVTYREYYDLSEDPSMLDNLLGDGDPSNDPDTTEIAETLGRDRTCRGPAQCP